jgi:iron complex outermembrane recepter protein
MPSLWRVMKVLAAAAAIAVASTAWAQSKLAVEVDIPAQSLETSLRQFADAQKLQVVYVRSDLAGKQAPAVKGRLTVQEVIDRLLEGTQLVASFNGSDTVVIKPVAEPARGRSSATAPGAVALSSEARTDRDIHKAESITVTAQKRTELLIDVPQSVTVLSADDLAKLGATQFRDFANTVPGLTFMTDGAGRTQISLRGVTAGLDVGPTVGIYVDEVPYGSSTNFAGGSRTTLDVGLFDLDRIEVLRGPQGTLYGASTMGGLIKYVTRLPDATRFNGDALVGISSTEQGGLSYNVAGVVNAPIVTNTVALRASGFYSRDGGYIDNVALGQKDANRSNIHGGRLDLLFTPTNALSIRTTAFLQNISSDGEGTADYAFTGAPVEGSLEQRRLVAEPYDQRFRLVSGSIIYDLDWASLTSISSYQTMRATQAVDFSRLYLSFCGFIGRTCSAVGASSLVSTDRFVQEVRLASEGTKALEWVIGAFYTRESSDGQAQFILRDPSGQPVPNDLLTSSTPSVYKEYAAFGDLTWHLTNKFDVTGGVRYAENRQTFEQIGSGLFGSSRPISNSTEGVSTYLANARYRFSDHAIGYLRYATGYKPGGPNYLVNDPTTGLPLGPQTFEADRLKNYEAGFKAESTDRRFAIDVAGYYIDWSNIQIRIASGAFAGIGNAPGGARIQGGELALTAHPTPGFKITAALAYQDAKLLKAEPALGASEGERLPNVPRFTAVLNADYELPAGSLRPTIGATLRYADDRMASFNNSAFQQYHLPDYSTIDLRAGVLLGSIYLQFYVRNVTDERGQLSAFNTRGVAVPSILQPRTFGVTASTKF